MLLLHLLFWLLCSVTVGPAVSRAEDCTIDNCLLPCCQCAVPNNNPTLFNDTDVPQLVLLTFVGNLNQYALDPIRTILNPIHRNPNKCPISSTFFVNDNYTEYCLVQRLFDNHNEIAMTTSSNRCPLTNCYDENNWRRWTETDWQREIKQQRRNLVEQARIHQSHIKGFRVPHLQIDQNRHFESIRNFHFHYDSSILFPATNLFWPFTLNYPLDDEIHCLNCDEPIPPVEALWQFPLHEWIYPNATKSCRTLADATCLPDKQPHTVDLLFNFILYNFERYSSSTIGKRAPFVIELDLLWLTQHTDRRLEAIVRFLEYILTSPTHRHVYFVSMEQALEWLKYPRSLTDLADFWAFNCGDTIYEYDIECSEADFISNQQQKSSTNSEAKALKTNKTNGSDLPPLDRQSEELFRSNIVFHAVWIFIVLIISVLFYDKYFIHK